MIKDIKVFRFKTNINCGGCVATVKPYLEQTQGMFDWNVDTASKDKLLTVKCAGISKQWVIETIEKAGFKIELLHT